MPKFLATEATWEHQYRIHYLGKTKGPDGIIEVENDKWFIVKITPCGITVEIDHSFNDNKELFIEVLKNFDWNKLFELPIPTSEGMKCQLKQLQSP